ncbi:PREDICTED: rab GTPase-binding effector protein 1-like, partial [Rhagoletis zephyria]|uniref:rab GTPase-binding effector protein 1-like n=1 Tax=Rhagoletis zephyria TaxID=28612 RepID=UPI0008115F2D
MGSTPDIPTIEIIDKSLDKIHSISNLSLEENGISEGGSEKATADAEVASSKSAPAAQTTEPGGTSTPTAATASNAACTCPHPPRPASTAHKPMACEMCNNYEMQLQEVQYHEGVLHLEISSHEKTIKQLKEELKKEQKFRAELEEKYNEEAKKTEQETRALSTKVDEGQKVIAKLTSKFNHFEKKSNDLVQELISQVESLKKELTRVNHENEILLGKTLARAAQLMSEEINLPQAQDDLQLYALKQREDLITALVAKERIEDTLKAENVFLKEQLMGEQQSNKNLEENFAQETDVLNTSLESKKLELSDYKKRYIDTQRDLDQLKANFNQLTISSGSRISELEHQCAELANYKTKAESEILGLKNKVQSLQVELDNSEAVQRDFVKLSQSLQVQLEKIRQADTEVRWQYEDDVLECNSCKKVFNSKKEK